MVKKCVKIYNLIKIFNRVKYIILLFLSLIIFPAIVQAANPAIDVLEDIGTKKGPYVNVGEYGVPAIIGTVIQALLGLIGLIFLVLMLYAGYNWMIARGEEEKVEKAKDTITRAIIGLIIVVGAYAIWAFVFARLF